MTVEEIAASTAMDEAEVRACFTQPSKTRPARRGLTAVYGELLEKALAYNLCHFVRLRQRAQARARRDGEPHRFAAAA